MRRALTLEEIDRDLYRIPHEVLWTPPAGRSVFGGQIVAGCVHAAHKTLEGIHADFTLSSLHSYFLLGGDSTRNITLRVERLRDGGSFATRAVTASQHGKAIFSAEVQFHAKEPSSISHQVAMPEGIPPPESLLSMQDTLRAILNDKRMHPKAAPFVQKYLKARERAPDSDGYSFFRGDDDDDDDDAHSYM